jgi:glycosyltransferase involved in cell wall biosynthesis
MKVAHLIKTGSGATWAIRQMEALRALGVEVEVVLAESGPKLAEYEAANIPVHLVPSDLARLRTPGKFLAARSEFRRTIDRIAPDIIHAHFVGSAMFARLALRPGSRVPRLFQVPGPLHLENAVTRRAEIVTADARDRWIATCALTKRIYETAGVAPGRVALCYYGARLEPLTQGNPARLRAELARFPATTKLIGSIAFFYPPKRWLGQTRGLKGHEDLIDAVALLRGEGRDVAAVFAGAAWGAGQRYEAEVRAYAAEKLGDRAVFLGFRSDVPDIYAGLDLAVHPSLSENLGGAGESLAAGTPTLASRTGGLPDVVRHGETGLLFRPADPADLAAQLRRALDQPDEGRTMAAAGQAWVLEHLSVDRTAREIAELYSAVAAGRF